ncbi:HU family DNA-binding protein [Bacteroides sp.]|uniref:HU family DNA-binding protein n=1 Tax=Bacteroides sp. TaxID=29523 RepID=UPI003FA5814D
MTLVTASKAVDAVFDTIRGSLGNGDSTTIQGFGSFTISTRAERRGVNPSIKQPMTFATRKVAKFTVSKGLEIK